MKYKVICMHIILYLFVANIMVTVSYASDSQYFGLKTEKNNQFKMPVTAVSPDSLTMSSNGVKSFTYEVICLDPDNRGVIVSLGPNDSPIKPYATLEDTAPGAKCGVKREIKVTFRFPSSTPSLTHGAVSLFIQVYPKGTKLDGSAMIDNPCIRHSATDFECELIAGEDYYSTWINVNEPKKEVKRAPSANIQTSPQSSPQPEINRVEKETKVDTTPPTQDEIPTELHQEKTADTGNWITRLFKKLLNLFHRQGQDNTITKTEIKVPPTCPEEQYITKQTYPHLPPTDDTFELEGQPIETITCHMGNRDGENVNHAYCTRSGKIIDSSGNIGGTLQQKLEYELTVYGCINCLTCNECESRRWLKPKEYDSLKRPEDYFDTTDRLEPERIDYVRFNLVDDECVQGVLRS